MGKILIVDDSGLIRSVASDAAKEAGHEVVVAEHGQEGLDMLGVCRINNYHFAKIPLFQYEK
jgi:CheY-like chemotaxis protein